MATRKPANRKTSRRGRAASQPGTLRRALRTVLGFRLMRTGLLLVAFLSTWVLFNYDSIQELSRISEESRRLQSRAVAIQHENEQLTRLRNALAAPDNRSSVERLAREQEKMIYEGEVLVHIDRSE